MGMTTTQPTTGNETMMTALYAQRDATLEELNEELGAAGIESTHLDRFEAMVAVCELIDENAAAFVQSPVGMFRASMAELETRSQDATR